MHRDNLHMKKPPWWALVTVAFVFAAATILLGSHWLLPRKAAPGAEAGAAAAGQGLPWQVVAHPDGTSRVMGLHLGSDTLAQARARTGDLLQVALVAPLGEVGTLEALAEPFDAGFISGRLVLSFHVPADTLRRWREGATGSSPMDGGVRRFALRSVDVAEAERAPLAGLSFVPVPRLTAADVRQRFGPPDSERTLDNGATLMSYTALGVAATVAQGQRAVIQYVAPRDAARLEKSAGRGGPGAVRGTPAASAPPAAREP
jgi:hypothetical protein